MKLKRLLVTLLAVSILLITPCNYAYAANQGGSIASGIDVSKYNGAINWNQVAASGIQYTFIKAGSTYSGKDPTFDANLACAQAAGIKTGVYLYSYATTPEQAAAEANLLLQWIAGYPINFPVVFDIEDKCQKGLSNPQLINIVNSFCSIIDAAGYYPMVYSNKSMLTTKLAGCGWDKWVAQYNTKCEYNGNICFWQYSSKGSVPGINGNVDMNFQFKNYDALIIPEGFLAHNGGIRFYRNWLMQRGWVAYNGTKYYLDQLGNMFVGWFTDDSGTYYLNPADGSIARGQFNVDGVDFYFDINGVKSSGWVTAPTGLTFYYDPANNGILRRDWMADDKGNYYFFDRADGHMYVGPQIVDGAEYFFTAQGVRFTGWAAFETGTFYYDPVTGIKAKGFLNDEKGCHYLDMKDGHMIIGPTTIDKKNYFFDANGVMFTGMLATDAGIFYYDPTTGQMVTDGFFAADNKIYYADKTGKLAVGVSEIQKNKFYFDATGALVQNQAVEIDGLPYMTSPEGILVPMEVPAAPATPAASATGTATAAPAASTAPAVPAAQ